MEKAEIREAVLARRRQMNADDRRQCGEAIASHLLALPSIGRARRVAAYVSMPTEPSTDILLEGLQERGIEVILPVCLPNHQLDWVVYERESAIKTNSMGIGEPTGERLGPETISSAGIVLVPALSIDHRGTRIGRGAGYYDRALQKVSATICAVVFADEIVESLPHENHDVAVHMAATPAGIFRVL